MIGILGYAFIGIGTFVLVAVLLRQLYERHPYFHEYSRRDLKEIEDLLRRNKPK